MRRSLGRVAVVLVTTLALLANAPAASAIQSATWGWTTDSLVMSFYGGIPYRGCERATLAVPDAGSSGDVHGATFTTIVVGLDPCSTSTIPSSLNANTIKTRTRVLRNGALLTGCMTSVRYNTTGQGMISASTGSNCEKTSTTDATWRVSGYYGWWDYDDTTWRSEIMGLPLIED